jgi:hypothetical protein
MTDTHSAVTAQLHSPPDLASEQDILQEFTSALGVCGVVGEDRNAKLTFLAITSRLLEEPVSLAAKGASSIGKSFMTETVLRFFPPEAYFEMTAMSERALVYSKDDFTHRTLVLFEAVALREQREKAESNLTAYFVRSLLSEGRIRYPVTVRDKDGNFTTKVVEKNGPTNLILTTTATSLHGENETRLLSLPMNDTQAQTRAVMLQQARGAVGEVDFESWHALQRWIDIAEHKVEVPYREFLARTIPPVAIRLRRDFRAILRLIETHAILHQLNRDRDEDGRILATEADYFAVRELVADLVSDGVGATVSQTMRETVECVRSLTLSTDEGTPVNAVAAELKLDRSAAQRRLYAARDRGYVVNLEERRGRPGRYAIGEPMPDEVELLPRELPDAQRTPHECETAGQEGVCTCAETAEGIEADPVDQMRIEALRSRDEVSLGQVMEAIKKKEASFAPGDVVRQWGGLKTVEFKVKGVDGANVDAWELDHGAASKLRTFKANDLILVRKEGGD